MASYDDLPPGVQARARRAIVMSIWRHGEVTAAMLAEQPPLEDDEEFLADWATAHGLEFAEDGRVVGSQNVTDET